MMCTAVPEAEDVELYREVSGDYFKREVSGDYFKTIRTGGKSKQKIQFIDFGSRNATIPMYSYNNS